MGCGTGAGSFGTTDLPKITPRVPCAGLACYDTPMAEKTPADPSSVGLPVRTFLYTVEQIAFMLNLDESTVMRRGYLHFTGLSIGTPPPDLIAARNIAPPGQAEVWRVAEQELVRWLKRKGFHIYLRGWTKK